MTEAGTMTTDTAPNSMVAQPNRGWKWIPLWDPNQDPKDRETDVLAFVNRVINHRSRFRRWNMQRMALNIWFLRGRQWIEPVHRMVADGSGNYHFREIYRNSTTAFPRPVTNLIAPYVDNETARLGKREMVPATYPTKQVADFAEAAGLAKDVLLYNLRMQRWADKREELGLTLCITGTAILKSYWDETCTSVMPIASQDAAACGVCGSKFASAAIPDVYAKMGMPTPHGPIPFPHSKTLQPVKDKPEVKMTTCPVCPNPNPLHDYQPSRAEVLGGKTDFFGRPLGFTMPKGEACLATPTPFDIFPENGGVGVEPRDCKLWGQRTVYDLDYIASRLPGIADDLHAEDSIELMRYHPTMGEQAFTVGGYSAVGETDIYPNHAAWNEVVVEPLDVPGLEDGRHFIVVNDRVAFDDVLLCDVDMPDGSTRQISRAQYSACRMKRVPGEFWGRTPVDDGISLNRRLNELDSQIQDIRERFSPSLYLPEGAEIFTKDDTLKGAARIFFYDVQGAGLADDFKLTDHVLGGAIPITGNAYMEERGQIIADFGRIVGPTPLEAGDVSRLPIRTTSGLMILSDEAAQRRAPVERGLVDMFEEQWSHHLGLIWAMRKDDMKYEVLSKAGTYEKKSFTGTDLLGQVDVRIEKQAGFDTLLYQREAAAEAQDDQLYVLDGPVARKRLLELRGLPDDVNEDASLQIKRAEEAWSDFIRSQTVPVIDPELHEPQIWYQVLGKRWLSDDAKRMQDACNWSKNILPSLTGWQDEFATLQQQAAEIRALYAGQPPQTWGAIYAKAKQHADQDMQLRQQAQAAGEPPPPTPPIPQPPPPPPGGKLPAVAMEQQIYLCFKQMVQLQAGPDEQPLGPTPPPGAKPEMLKDNAGDALSIDLLLRMRAVIEAYLKMSQAKAAAGAPASPGGGPEAAQPAPPQGPAAVAGPQGGA